MLNTGVIYRADKRNDRMFQLASDPVEVGLIPLRDLQACQLSRPILPPFLSVHLIFNAMLP